MAEGEPVAIYCEGKEHAIAIGVLKMSTDAIASVNSGIAVECLHFLNDGLYFNSKVA
jgi:PUA domain protein